MHMLTKPKAVYHNARKMALSYQNPLYMKQAQRKQPVLYDGKTLVVKHEPIFIFDSKETLHLAEESQLKMKAKQAEHNDKLVDYSKLNKLYEYFVPQKQISAEQAYWLPVSKMSVVKVKPVKDVPKQLPKTSKAKMFFNKAKDQLDTFDELIKVKTTINVLNWGDFGVHHVKRAYESDVKPLVTKLRESLTQFEKEFHKEVLEMKEIFEGMETDVDQCSVEKKYFEIKKKELLIKNDRLLEECLSKDLICTIVHSFDTLDEYSEMACQYLEKCGESECLQTELSNKMKMLKTRHLMSFQKDLQNLRNILFLLNLICNNKRKK
ncbi:hypothetical protein Tco_1535565 [Tanacetum coccineum]